MKQFSLERGWRHGDPLSPFYFILIAPEGLHVMMNDIVEAWLFYGYNISGHGSLNISHLQFSDDTLLLGEKI